MRLSSGIMIDGPDTVDRDDAIWVERDGDGWDVTVHIACVADIVAAGGPADRRAAQKKRTIYLPDGVLPMLPRAIEDRATLHPQKPRPVITVAFRVGLDGIVSQTSLAEGTLASPVAMDYATATAAITDPGHPQHDVLREAHEVAHVLLTHRRDHGALVLYDLSQGLASDGDGGLLRLNTVERHAAYMIVAELMVAANQAIAGFAVTYDLPILFRNHQPARTAPPREQLLEELRLLIHGEAWRREATGQRLGHLLRPAVYAPHASEHYGLKLSWYCHATSPLRRYADLLVQRQLLAVLRGQTPPHDVAGLAGHAEAINTTLARARERRGERNAEARREQRRGTLADGAFSDLPADDFHKVLKLAIAEGRHGEALETEVVNRIADGRMQPRTAHQLLLVADEQWSTAHDALLPWLTASPEHAVTILAMHAQLAGMQAPDWDERPVGTVQQPLFSARAGITVDGITTWSPPRVELSKNLARQQAALSLIATLVAADDPSTSREIPAPAPAPVAADVAASPNPAMAVNELGQRGVLTGVGYAYDSTGPAHKPSFTCTVHARHEPTAAVLAGTGTGATKAAAKTAAAGDLYEQITAGAPA
ncbi:ribonuclease catalytic domain-containing protein [Amycolatopsis sp. NPDC004378]